MSEQQAVKKRVRFVRHKKDNTLIMPVKSIIPDSWLYMWVSVSKVNSDEVVVVAKKADLR
jgi:hypothetical protein